MLVVPWDEMGCRTSSCTARQGVWAEEPEQNHPNDLTQEPSLTVLGMETEIPASESQPRAHRELGQDVVGDISWTWDGI